MFVRKRPYPFTDEEQHAPGPGDVLGNVLGNVLGDFQSWQWHEIQGQQWIPDYDAAGFSPPTANTEGQPFLRDQPDLWQTDPLHLNGDINGNNDNVIIAGRSVEEQDQICFGSIPDVKAQLRLPPPVCYDVASVPFRKFNICPYGAFYAMESSGTRFAILNKKMCQTIQPLLRGREVRLQASVPREEWTRVLRCWRTERTSTLVNFDLDIYGSRRHAADVGKILSSADLFLQQPAHDMAGFIYYNPHYLHAEEVLGGRVFETPLADVEGKGCVTDSKEMMREKEQRVDDTVEIDSILNSLSHHAVLKKSTKDKRVKTSLLDHQAEALDFIFRRETGTLPVEMSLWRHNQDLYSDSDQGFYQHIITGAGSIEHEDARGGILADDMGLGKSLVILSTIAGSLDRAHAFVSERQADTGRSSVHIMSRSTLVVVPSSLLIDSWVDEIRKHTFPGSLAFHKHHGSGREEEQSQKQLLESDIVFTTYATAAAELRHGRGILRCIDWFRIVLDEAHDIRNRSTKQYQATALLRAKHRWCLTGTPIQNSIEDLSTLVSFLRLPSLENPATFRKFIASPSASRSRERFKNLRVLLGSICLRRTREILGLPDPVPQDRKLEFTPLEREEYDDIHRQCRRKIDMAVSGHGKGKLNSTVLESLLKLRLYCNNGMPGRGSEPASPMDMMDVDEILSYLEQNNEAECAYCFRPVYSISDARDTDGGLLIPDCRHLVCRGCLPQYYAGKSKCPQCRSGDNERSIPFGVRGGIQPLSRDNVFVPTRTRYPSKLLAFLDDVSVQVSQKSITFSSWKKTLSLMGELLRTRNVPFYYIHGSLSLSERLRILHEFRSPHGANILLMTLGTGAVGLNLAVATRIYLMEPQWNPSVELQAIGRSLRLGQTDQVTIIRYIMKGTVEDSNVLSRQRTKLQLAGGGFEKRKRGISDDRFQRLLGHFDVQV